jgi:hypothetical protein
LYKECDEYWPGFNGFSFDSGMEASGIDRKVVVMVDFIFMA